MDIPQPEDLPIVGLCVVNEPGNCPPNFILIERTYNSSEDADLWKDGIFGRRVTRYMCLEKAVPAENQDVLVDVALTNDKDPVPAGFTVIEYTHDTREKTIKKQCLCIRWMNPNMTTSSITDLIFMSKGTRRPPTGYTLVGEMNHLALCYKMNKLPSKVDSKTNLPYQMPGYHGRNKSATEDSKTILLYQMPGYHGLNMEPIGECLQYATKQPAGNLVVPGTNALAGVPWEFNSNIQYLAKTTNISCPVVKYKYKSMMEIENEYAYDFHVEKSVVSGRS